MPWTTREHWYWGFVLPGRFPLLLLSVGVPFAFTPWIWGLPVALLLIIPSLVGIAGALFRWRAFFLSFLPGGKTLVERNGPVIIAERRISLTMVGSMTFEQTMMGRILDYGTLTVGAMGGPYQWENLGHFRTLRRIIESQGEWMPPTGNALFRLLGRWIRQATLWVNHARQYLLQIIDSVKFEIQMIGEYLKTPSYQRFIEFAQELLFTKNYRRFESSFGVANAYSVHFTSDEIRIYQQILKTRHIIVSDFQGRTYLHKRIHTIQDLRKHVPISWFRKAVRSVQ
ncbi:MAG TPA: hypothetical protein VK206_02445 [Anaerolineales bacterium]|nr:hypothetical protein [Anaerolineales bacterium]HLO31844.1 hypothetical protein [Anaerolineales bacterium]